MRVPSELKATPRFFSGPDSTEIDTLPPTIESPNVTNAARCSIIITTNIAFKDWLRIFAGDASLTSVTSALLNRLLHHAQPVLIEGAS
jgi:IstB-like ATP binding protein